MDARSVVASLWPVDDDATERPMEAFYARLLSSAGAQPPAEALRHAALTLRAAERARAGPDAPRAVR